MPHLLLFIVIVFSWFIPVYATLPPLMIDEKGLGFIQADTPYIKIKEALGHSTRIQHERVFFKYWQAIKVMQDQETLFYLAYPIHKIITEETTFGFIYVVSPKFRTRENVGPGMKIAEAEKIYGNATLNFSTDDESGWEYVFFERQPEKIKMKTGRARDAGIYSDKDHTTTHFSTRQYQKNAEIQAVLIIF